MAYYHVDWRHLTRRIGLSPPGPARSQFLRTSARRAGCAAFCQPVRPTVLAHADRRAPSLMPSPVGHAIAGVAAGWLVAGAPNAPKVAGTFAGKVPATFLLEAVLFGALAALPDVDLLVGAHSGPTHSLGAAVIVGLRPLRSHGSWAPLRHAGSPGARLRRGVREPCAARLARKRLVAADRRHGALAVQSRILRIRPARVHGDLASLLPGVEVCYAECPGREPRAGYSRSDPRPGLAFQGPQGSTSGCHERRSSLCRARQPGARSSSPRWRSSPSRLPRRRATAARPPAGEHPYDSLLARYRSGAVEPAVAALTKLLEAEGGQRQATRWIALARATRTAALISKRRCSCSPTRSCSRGRHDHPLPAATGSALHVALHGPPSRAQADGSQDAIPAELVSAVGVVPAGARQSVDAPSTSTSSTRRWTRFPDDSQILLAAGSRHELDVVDVARECPAGSGQGTALDQEVPDARRATTFAAASTPIRTNPRHGCAWPTCSSSSNDLDDVPGVLSEHDWTADDPAFEYLARLFEGDLHERRGDTAGGRGGLRPGDRPRRRAAVGPRRARRMSRTSRASARRRPRLVTPALANRDDRIDPWWPYIRGQAWRFDAYLKIARAMVMK